MLTLLLATKTSGVGHIVGEGIEYFDEETTDLKLPCECECDSTR